MTCTRTGVNLWICFKTKQYRSVYLCSVVIMDFSWDGSSLSTSPMFCSVAASCWLPFLQVPSCTAAGETQQFQSVPGRAFLKTFIIIFILHLSAFPPLPQLHLAQLYGLQNKQVEMTGADCLFTLLTLLSLTILHCLLSSVPASSETIRTALAGVATLSLFK